MDPDGMLLLTATIVVLVILLIAIIFYMIARGFARCESGLGILVGQYPGCNPPEGESFSNQTVRIGDVWYKRCVSIIISLSGLYISVAVPFPGIPGGIALIPWDAITVEGEEQAFWTRYVRIRIDGDDTLRIALPDGIARVFPIA